MARSLDDPDHLLVGEAKLGCAASEVARLVTKTRLEAERCPWAAGKRLDVRLFVMRPRGRRSEQVIDAEQVLAAWRAAAERAA